ncbi:MULTISPECIES: ATP-binding cassette domain-containing protein [Aphanothece]|uniref:ABC transporter ATP-binding protein n=1 Tax=Aphanothece TaxID=1121 RepID=UPI00398470C1
MGWDGQRRGALVIEIADLRKGYGTGPRRVQALDGLSLSVPAGSLYGLLGPNGAGKTTTLRILCTLLAPDQGSVRVAGVDPLTDPRAVRRLLGYVAQEVAIDKILTGRELLQLQGDLYHLKPAGRDRRIEELVALLGMADWIDRRCGTYSGGMRRRLDLASGLLHAPQVLVLDEPTVGLDIESRAAIWDVLRRLRDGGTTVLLSSHYLEEVDALADRLAILEAGRVIAEGTPSELKDALGGDRVTLRVREFSDAEEASRVQDLLRGCQGVRQVVVNRAQGYSLNLVVEHGGVVEQLRRQLAQADLPVFALAQSRPSLDDVYLQATGRTLMDAELAVAGIRDPKAERKQSMR